MPHGSANPGTCATCHMRRVGDTGDGGAQYTGHRFDAIPCVDAQGVPTTGDCDESQRSFQACAGSGCHFSPSTARTFYDFNRQEVDSLAAELNALLAQAPVSAFRTGDGLITTAEGARFNAQLADKIGSVAHNPYLMKALLAASIQQMELDYGLHAGSAAPVDHTPDVLP